MMRAVCNSGATLLLRRAYWVPAENVKVPAEGSEMGKEVEKSVSGGGVAAERAVQKETYWMKDPKTGNWIPETHFDQVDIAELREKILPSPRNRA